MDCYKFALLTLSLVLCGAQLPPLPGITDGNEQLEIHVVASISRTNGSTTRNYTIHSQEFIDERNDRTKIVSVMNSLKTEHFVDLATKQGFAVTRSLVNSKPFEAECTTTNISNSTRPDPFGVTFSSGQLHVTSIANLLGWLDTYSPTEVGSASVRGIQSKKYVGNQTVSVPGYNLVTQIEYYISDNYQMPYFAANAQIPVRLIVSGSSQRGSGASLASHTFYHIYDYTLIAPLGNRDDSFFNVPRGVFCVGRVSSGLRLPTANQYSMSEEVVISTPAPRTISQKKTFFDYSLSLTRQDFVEISRSESGRQTLTSISLVHDVSNMLTYRRFLDNETCRVERLAPGDPRDLSWDIKFDSDGRAMILRTAEQAFLQQLHYQGSRMERGIKVDVWANSTEDDSTRNITEIWITSAEFSVNNPLAYGETSVMSGYYMVSYQKNTNVVLREIFSNFYDVRIGPLNYTTFDAKECFDQTYNERQRFGVKMADGAQAFASKRVTASQIARQFRVWIASQANVSPLRVTDVLVYETSNSRVIELFFTLHAPPRIDQTFPEAADALVNQELAVAKAESFLDLNIGLGDFFFKVTSPDGRSATFTATGLIEEVTNDSESLVSSTAKTYTAGAMAGLGIGMLVLGALLMVGVGAIVWVKRFDINLPYTRAE